MAHIEAGDSAIDTCSSIDIGVHAEKLAFYQCKTYELDTPKHLIMIYPKYSGSRLSVRLLFRARVLFQFAFLLVVTFFSTSGFSIDVECGFGGFVKSEKWFPVRVRPELGVSSFDVYIMQVDPRGRDPKPLSLTRGSFPSRPGADGIVLCKLGQSYRKRFIRCQITHANGKIDKEDIELHILSKNDKLIISVGDTPHAFDFLGSIQLPNRGIVRVVNRSEKNFPQRWQALDCVDVVILDGSEKAFKRAQHDALVNWMTAGGTVFLTDHSFLLGPEKGTWGLFPEAKFTNKYERISSPELAVLLGQYGKHLESIQSLDLKAPEANRVIWTGDSTLIAAKDMGYGRLIALGFDWQNLQLKDRVFYESTRQMLWSSLLALQRPEFREILLTELVTPDEAKAKFLTKYIAIFLLAYVIILGPVNWLILRKIKKLEYSIFTIPAGAVIFSLIAFGIGVSLRSNDTILSEAEVLVAQDSPKGFISGTAGILSPDRTPYVLCLDDAYGLLECQKRSFMIQSREPRPKDMLLYSTEGAFEISNVKIGTWSMRYFATRAVRDLQGQLSVAMTCTGDGLRGVVDNGLPFVLRDVYVIHRWNRVSLGDLLPGVSLEFSLPLLPADREIFPKCRNCHRYHGRDVSFTKEFCRKHPISEDIRVFVSALRSNKVMSRHVLVGWQDVPESYLKLNRGVINSKRQRLCVFPIDMFIDSPEVIIPEGLVAATRVSNGEQILSAPFATDIRYQGLTDSTGKRTEDMVYPYTPSFCFPGGCMLPTPSKKRERIYDFRLPFKASKLVSSRLCVHWDAGEPHPDSSPIECVLLAYDWTTKEWVELAKAQSGERTIDVDAPEKFVGLPSAMVRLKLAPVTKSIDRKCPLNFLEISYEGRKAD